MNTLLRIDASSRLEGSHSRELADAYVEAWQKAHDGGRVVTRDLVREPIPHIAQDTITGFYTPADSRSDALKDAVALSDRLIAELRTADELLIATPMYNFTVPSSLKAWIDQVVRIHETFAYDGSTFDGLLKNRRATILGAYGARGYADGGAFAAANFTDPYLTFLLGFLGFEDVQTITVEATTDADAIEQNLADATEQLRRAARRSA